jgi:hypothetical protein
LSLRFCVMRNGPNKNIGYAPSVVGVAGLLRQLPGGALLDVCRSKRLLVAVVASMWLAGPMMPRGSPALTAEVAEKCEGLANRAYPLRVPGNPAAGRLYGTGRDFLDYFNTCVANGGDVGTRDTHQAPK